jgi:hypothetical protein
MPYKVKGKLVYHKKHGKWSIKQHTCSNANAKKAVRLLRAIEHGWKLNKR